jgi:nitrate reductase NapAB chaperone NapD
MKKIIVFFTIVTSLFACKSSTGEAQRGANETEKNIYKSADSMMTAFKKKDWQMFAHFNHPAMMKMMGGEENFAAYIQAQMKQIPDTAIKKMDVGKILQVIKTSKDVQCVVEQSMIMVLDNIRISNTSYLVGESLDDGKTWTFFDASSTGMMTPKDVKPDISPELKIPTKKQDVKQL